MPHTRRGSVSLPIATALITLVSTSDLVAESAYDQAKLQAFVAAWTSADRINGQWQQQIDQSDSREQRIALMNECNAEIRATIEAMPGITFVEYQEIIRAAQDDPGLMQRINNIAE